VTLVLEWIGYPFLLLCNERWDVNGVTSESSSFMGSFEIMVTSLKPTKYL